jgi:hypothetical protein
VSRAAAAVAVLVLGVAACGGDHEEPAADVAAIHCSAKELTVTPKVEAGSDGRVRLEVHVSDERGVSVTVNGIRANGAMVIALPEGTVGVVCRDGSGGSMRSFFEVVGQS